MEATEFSSDEVANALADDEGPEIMGKSRKKPFKFNIPAEILLLKEIILLQPFKSKHSEITKCWAKVAEKCGNNYSGETARKHFNNLLSDFKKNESRSLKLSGTEEEHDEKTRLLQDISDLIADTVAVKGAKAKKSDDEAASKITGKAIRDAAMNGIVKISPKGNMKTLKRGAADSDINDKFVDFLEKKHKDEHSLRERELALQERKMALDEKKFESDAHERSLLFSLLKERVPDKKADS